MAGEDYRIGGSRHQQQKPDDGTKGPASRLLPHGATFIYPPAPAAAAGSLARPSSRKTDSSPCCRGRRSGRVWQLGDVEPQAQAAPLFSPRPGNFLFRLLPGRSMTTQLPTAKGPQGFRQGFRRLMQRPGGQAVLPGQGMVGQAYGLMAADHLSSNQYQRGRVSSKSTTK